MSTFRAKQVQLKVVKNFVLIIALYLLLLLYMIPAFHFFVHRLFMNGRDALNIYRLLGLFFKYVTLFKKKLGSVVSYNLMLSI